MRATNGVNSFLEKELLEPRDPFPFVSSPFKEVNVSLSQFWVSFQCSKQTVVSSPCSSKVLLPMNSEVLDLTLSKVITSPLQSLSKLGFRFSQRITRVSKLLSSEGARLNETY